MITVFIDHSGCTVSSIKDCFHSSIFKDSLITARALELLGDVIMAFLFGVGSVDSNAEISEFTSTGKGLDIMAPGENIISSSMLEGIVVCEGTSMSVPHVVGVASLIKENDKTRDGKFIKELLINSANKSGEFGEMGLAW